MTGSRERAWKANLLVPVEDPAEVEEAYGLLRDVAHPKGFVRLLGLTGKREYSDLVDSLPRLAAKFGEEGVFATSAVMELSTYADNLVAGMEALGGAFFRSSMIFLRLPPRDRLREAQLSRVVSDADRQGLGILLYAPGNDAAPRPGPIHLVLERPDGGWEIGLNLGGADLALLVAYKLKRNKKRDLVLSARLRDDAEREQALAYLKSVAELARIPDAHLRTVGPSDDDAELAPAITIFMLKAPADLTGLREQARRTATPCLFALDSGRENALA